MSSDHKINYFLADNGLAQHGATFRENIKHLSRKKLTGEIIAVVRRLQPLFFIATSSLRQMNSLNVIARWIPEMFSVTFCCFQFSSTTYCKNNFSWFSFLESLCFLSWRHFDCEICFNLHSFLLKLLWVSSYKILKKNFRELCGKHFKKIISRLLPEWLIIVCVNRRLTRTSISGVHLTIKNFSDLVGCMMGNLIDVKCVTTNDCFST